MSLFHNIEPGHEELLLPIPHRKMIIGDTITLIVSPRVTERDHKPTVLPHRHNIEQISWLLEGECELRIETTDLKDDYLSLPDNFVGQPAETHRIKAGDFFRIPSGALHDLTVIKGPCSWLSIYHPIYKEESVIELARKRNLNVVRLEPGNK